LQRRFIYGTVASVIKNKNNGETFDNKLLFLVVQRVFPEELYTPEIFETNILYAIVDMDLLHEKSDIYGKIHEIHNCIFQKTCIDVCFGISNIFSDVDNFGEAILEFTRLRDVSDTTFASHNTTQGRAYYFGIHQPEADRAISGS
jgi:hypothetical protein